MYTVVPFDESNFHLLVRNHSPSLSDTVAEKRQVRFLCNYLKAKNASTIVIESDYIDSHFIQDFSYYYSSSFFDNGRKCYRLHVFDGRCYVGARDKSTKKSAFAFTTKEFEDLLFRGKPSTISIDTLKDSYLGFIIIKPLQESIIGKTCLETYEQFPKNRERCFKAVHTYKAHLYGVPLEVKSTLPFQEQDTVVSVCATSALWTYFHAFAQEPHMLAPSSAKITGSITKSIFLPNKINNEKNGLNLAAIISALEHFGIEPIMYETRYFSVLHELVLAYMDNLTEPLLLLVDRYTSVPDTSDSADGVARSSRQPKQIQFAGSHLVVATGYGMQKPKEWSELTDTEVELIQEPDAITLYPEYLDRLYVHDDQVGPFAKFTKRHFKLGEIEILASAGSESAPIGPANPSSFFYSTPDEKELTFFQYEIKDATGKNLMDDYLYIPTGVITGRPSKVKSKYSNIKKGVNGIAALIGELLPVGQTEHYSWKIRLARSNDYKMLLQQRAAEQSDQSDLRLLKELLTTNLPKYIWVCTLHDEGNHRLIEIVLDSTDLLTLTSCFLGVMVYNSEFLNRISTLWQNAIKSIIRERKQASGKSGAADQIDNDPLKSLESELLVESFRKFLESPTHGIEDDLDDSLFSLSLPPIYIKADEKFGNGEIKPFTDYKKIPLNKKASFKLEDFDTDATYLWLIDDEYIYFAKEVPEGLEHDPLFKLGHPCLNGGKNARLAGELQWRGGTGQWLFSNASGRYCAYRKKEETHFRIFILLLKQKEFILNENCDYMGSERHTADRLGNLGVARKEIDEKLQSPANDHAGDDSREQLARFIVYGLPESPADYFRLCQGIVAHLDANVEKFTARTLAFLCFLMVNDSYDSRLKKACSALNADGNCAKITGFQKAVMELANRIYDHSEVERDPQLTLQVLKRLTMEIRSLPNDKMNDRVQQKINELLQRG